MFFNSVHQDLDSVRDSAKPVLKDYFGGERPRFFDFQNVRTFFGELKETASLIIGEPEILLFAGLQWLAVAFGYVAWTQMLYWIPDDLWAAASSDQDDSYSFFWINLALLAWSLLLVAAASYPIAILNAAMIAARNLRTLGQRPGAFACLDIAMRHSGRLWAFTTVDAWITVNEIFARLPRKHHHHTMFDEFVYCAWKIGTIGVVPALVAGKGFARAGRDSLDVLKQRTAKAVGLRMGYSLLCWVVGILAYAGGIVFLIAFSKPDKAQHVYDGYALVARSLRRAGPRAMDLARNANASQALHVR